MEINLEYFKILDEQLKFVKMTFAQRKDVNDSLEMIKKQLTIPVVGVSLCDETESNRQDSSIALWTKDSKPENYA